MKFSFDGRYLVSVGEDKVLCVWSVVEDERCEEYDVFKMDFICIYFEVSNLFELRFVVVEKDGVNGGLLMSLRKIMELVCVIIFLKIFCVVDKFVYEFVGYSGDIFDVLWFKNNVSVCIFEFDVLKLKFQVDFFCFKEFSQIFF